ncbi:U-box domain-containing protein 9-like isoform X2 [Zingiber officinale]|uniref:U-box domain-containing protein 9-like isoform X2 n=1 Tax=Zingiber officinale TaxID=94328 RepID=UPI001C4B9CCE|nr:U-box domain-containing protein 9-like isoform X2 [Zingiber officinale]
MANSEAVESLAGPASAAAATARAEELKKELWRLVREISESEDCSVESYEDASRALDALKDIRFRGSVSSKEALACQRKAEGKMEPAGVPKHFLCPISSETMRDPVILASGQEWFSSGNRTCPQTQQVLSDFTLTPNHLVRSMISQWRIEHGLTLPPQDHEQGGLITRKERNALRRILDKISSSSNIPEQKQAVRELRLLTKQNGSFRALVGENPDAISHLVSVLSVPGLNCDLQVQEDAVTTMLNLSIHESNKKIVGDNPQAVALLIEALRTGNMETRSNSAAALFSLSALESNKVKIVKMGAMKPLVELLEQGSHSAKKDAGSAIFNLCISHENRAGALMEGVVGVLLKSIADQSLVDESLAILALLSRDQEAVEEIAENGGVASMLSLVKDSDRTRNKQNNKENAAAILFAICMHDRTKLREVAEEEEKTGSISHLAENGTPRARRKAAGILEKWKKRLRSTHYSC